MAVTAPGLYRMTPAEYHADPCPDPSLSASMIREILERSPLHGWHMHPRLNPDFEIKPSSQDQDEGTVLHFLLLGAGEPPVIVDADNWTTKAARELRDSARRAGRTPILRWRYGELRRAAVALRREARATLDAPEGIGDGIAEAVLVWREGPVWCRCMVDWLPLGCQGPAPLIDWKFSSRAATPEQVSRSAADYGYDIKAAWYRRGYQAVFGKPAGPLVFLTGEKDSPHGLSRLQLGPGLEEMGEEKVEEGLETWRICMNRQDWPGYPRRVGIVDARRYAADDWASRSSRGRQQLADGSRKGDLQRRIASMQRVQAAIGGPAA